MIHDVICNIVRLWNYQKLAVIRILEKTVQDLAISAIVALFLISVWLKLNP